MKLGRVIGRVTLSVRCPALKGARWLIVDPYSRESVQALAAGNDAPALGKGPSPVVYDNLGAGVGDTIGYVEGAEAAAPFDDPTPIDAIDAAIIDEVFYNPFKS